MSTAAIHTPGDSQARGVPLDWARIDPIGSAPPWRALLLTWGLAALAGWLWLLDAALLAPRPRWRGLRVAALVGVAAAALVLWARANPYALATALPAMPWGLGVASVLLAGVALRPLRARALPGPAIAALLALLVAAQALLTTHAAIALGAGLALACLALLPLDGRPTTDRRPTTNDQRPTPALSTVEGTNDQRLAGDCRLRTPNPQPLTPSPQPPTPNDGLRTTDYGLLSRRTELVILALLFLAALGLRFYRLSELPYGLWRDEGRHGLVALQMLADPSYRPAYIANRVDLPGLGLLPFTLALRAWGIEVWSLRTITALAGALTILPLYALTRRLYGRGTLALLAAGLLAVSSWSITISRFSFPTIFDPLLQVTGLWLLLVGLQPTTDDRPTTNDQRPTTNDQRPTTNDQRPTTNGKGARNTQHATRNTQHATRKLVALFLSGVCLGLAAQTYHTGRLGIAVAGVLALLLLIHAPRAWRAWLIGMATLCVGFVLAASPLIDYALRNPSTFNQRVGTVFLLSDESSDKRPPLARLDESVGRHLLMFNVRGDSNGRHAAPNRPMLDFVTGLGFLAGVVALLRRRTDWRSQFLLAALAIGLLPSLLAVDSPHGMRSIDALPIACIVAALGLAQIWHILMSINDQRPTTNDQRPTTNDEHQPRHSSLVTRHLSLVTRHPSPVTRHSSLVTHETSQFSILHSQFSAQWRYFATGVLAGLACLAHVYGGLVLALVGALLLWRDGLGVLRRPAPYLIAAGFALALLPWTIYIAQDVPAYAGQMLPEQTRFRLWDPAFYLDSLLREPSRYSRLLRIDGATELWPRLGIWIALLGLPISCILLLWRALPRTQNQESRTEMAVSPIRFSDRLLLLALPLLALLLALLVNLKFYNYIVLLLPFVALNLALLAVCLWHSAAALPLRSRVAARAALGGLLLLALLEGLAGVRRSLISAAAISPYAAYTERVAAAIPPGARVLALHQFWFGLYPRDYIYRSMALAYYYSDPRFYTPAPLPMDEALARIAPAYVLVDRYMAPELHMDTPVEALADERGRRFRSYLARHCAYPVAQIADPDYGDLTIYRLCP